MTHQNKIGFNDTQIYMTGDSAGGELYAACGLTDNKHQIRHLFPMYAAIDITDTARQFIIGNILIMTWIPPMNLLFTLV